MGKDLQKLAIGAALIAASIAIPPLAIVGTLTVNGVLFGVGAGFAIGALTSTLPEHQSMNLSTSIGPMSAIPVVYGQARVGVSMADGRKKPGDPDILYVPLAFCVGSENGTGIDDVLEILFDGETVITNPVVDGTLSTSGIDSRYAGKLSYSIHLGTDAQTLDAELGSTFATEWPVTSDGRAVAYMVLRLTFDPDVYPTGLPDVSAVVRGQKVYDPRDLSTAWSDNPALCVLDWLTSAKYGYAFDLTDIDTESFEDAANYCDEVVNTTAYSGKRFTCNGVVNTAEERYSNLVALLSSCRGSLVFQGGIFRMIINQPETPTTFGLNESNIVGDWRFNRVGEVPNTVTAAYIDPAADYQVREVTWPEAGQANNFLAADNGVPNHVRMELPFTTNVYIAQQIAMVLLREAREDIVISHTAKEEVLKLQVADVAPLTHRTPGFTAKPFRVAAMAPLPNATVRMLLREYDDGCYTLDTQNTQDTGSGTDLPNVHTCQPPTVLVLVLGTSQVLNHAGYPQPRISISWTAAPEPFLDHYEVQFKRDADSVYTPLPNVPRDIVNTITPALADDDTYDVRVRAVNTLGVASTWLEGTVSMLPLIRTVDYSLSGKGLLFRWDANAATLGLWIQVHNLSDDIVYLEELDAADGSYLFPASQIYSDLLDTLVIPWSAWNGTSASGTPGPIFAKRIEGAPLWLAPTLLNSWANVASRETAGYRLDREGMVRLKGQVTGGTGTTGTAILTLPAGWRPEAQQSFLVNATSTLDIETDGDLVANGAISGTLNLGAISFRVAV